MMGLVAVSAVIAGVGLVNLLTLGVVQRRRELGLLRALGVSNAQVRRMVLLEAAHITITATATGLLLGVVYGWAGAQSLLGSVPTNPDALPVGTFVWPAVPFWPVARDRRRDRGAHPRRGGRADPARDPRRPGRGARRVDPATGSGPVADGMPRSGFGRGIRLPARARAASVRVVRPARRQRAHPRAAPLPRSTTARATATGAIAPPITRRSRHSVRRRVARHGGDRDLVVPDVELGERAGQRDAAVAEDPHLARRRAGIGDRPVAHVDELPAHRDEPAEQQLHRDLAAGLPARRQTRGVERVEVDQRAVELGDRPGGVQRPPRGIRIAVDDRASAARA